MRNNRQLIRKYIVLKNGSDLYCYYSETNRKKIIFMHSMVGCHIEKLGTYEYQFEEGKIYHRLQIHLSQHTRRVLFFETHEESEKWFMILNKATDSHDI